MFIAMAKAEVCMSSAQIYVRRTIVCLNLLELEPCQDKENDCIECCNTCWIHTVNAYFCTTGRH